MISTKLYEVAAIAPDSAIGIAVKLLADSLAKDEKRRQNQKERTDRCRAKKAGNVTVTPLPERYCNATVTLPMMPITSSVSLTELESKKERKLQRSRGSRLSPDWVPSDEDREFARNLGFSDDEIDEIAAIFLDYWIALSGSKATKMSWAATWRGWIRREAKKYKKTAQPRNFTEIKELNNLRVIHEVLGPKRPIQTNEPQRLTLGSTPVRSVPQPESDGFNF